MIGYGMAAYCFRGFISLLFILPKLIRNRAAGVFYRVRDGCKLRDASTGHLINEGRSAAACIRPVLFRDCAAAVGFCIECIIRICRHSLPPVIPPSVPGVSPLDASPTLIDSYIPCRRPGRGFFPPPARQRSVQWFSYLSPYALWCR